MSEKKIEQSLKNLKNALFRLEEAVEQPSKDRLSIDGTFRDLNLQLNYFGKRSRGCWKKKGLRCVPPENHSKKHLK